MNMYAIRLRVRSPFDFVRNTAGVLILCAVTALAVTVAVPSAANADGAGPAYFLGSSRTGEYGPCANNIGTPQGVVPIGNYRYRMVYKGHHWVGDYSFYDYQDRGFDTAYLYRGCYNNYPAYGFYGAHEISRDMEIEYECPADEMSCLYRGTHYGSWRSGW